MILRTSLAISTISTSRLDLILIISIWITTPHSVGISRGVFVEIVSGRWEIYYAAIRVLVWWATLKRLLIAVTALVMMMVMELEEHVACLDRFDHAVLSFSDLVEHHVELRWLFLAYWGAGLGLGCCVRSGLLGSTHWETRRSLLDLLKWLERVSICGSSWFDFYVW